MFGFEYLNKQKMPSATAFMDTFGEFMRHVDRSIPAALEVRNRNYLTGDFFKFMDDLNIFPVLSEKQYMPHVHEVYRKYRNLINGDVVVRLPGGDRNLMVEKTREVWNEVIDPKPDLGEIADCSVDIKYRGNSVSINVNNHYEGSAPKTIDRLKGLIAERSKEDIF